MEADTAPRRRFALATGLVLFLFTNVGLTLESPMRISVVGIQLTIGTPELFIWGLFFVTVYAFSRYYYYDVIVKKSPRHSRRLLMNSEIPDALQGLSGPKRELEDKIKRYFPGIDSNAGEFDILGDLMPKFKIHRLSWKTKLLTKLEDLDYFLPLIVSGVAMVWFLGAIAINRLVSFVQNL